MMGAARDGRALGSLVSHWIRTVAFTLEAETHSWVLT